VSDRTPQGDRQRSFVHCLIDPDLHRQLKSEGRNTSTPAAVIERGTTPGERVVVGDLSDIAARAAAAGLRSPATLVVGEG